MTEVVRRPAHPDPPADDIRPGIGGRLRDELLNAWRFDSLLETRVIPEDWRADDNTNHFAHGQLAPTEFALQSTTTHQPQAAQRLDHQTGPPQWLL